MIEPSRGDICITVGHIRNIIGLDISKKMVRQYLKESGLKGHSAA